MIDGDEPEVLAPGDVVERYEVIRTIGAGGTAQVALARHTELGTLHAIKVLTLTFPGMRERLLLEGRAQATLRHPNVVAVTDVLTVDGRPGLVLEYVDGPNLEAWIRDAKPGFAEAERLFRGILAGAAAAHDAGLVHRDLKPANVLLATGDDGRLVPRIADFGLAKLVANEGGKRTRAGMPLGTPAYMAPEQIRSAAEVDRRADVWSLGCILYELVAHAQAFPTEDLVEVWERAAAQRREPLPEDTPWGVARAIDRCLRPDPEDRPADCAAILALLDDRRPPVGAIDPRAERASIPPRAGTKAWLVVLALLSSVLVVLALTGVVVLAALAGRGGGAVGAVDWPVCPTLPAAGGAVGWAPAPWVFDKPVGSVWRVTTETHVGTLPGDLPRVVACRLPPGARVEVVQPPVERGGQRWIAVDGAKLVLGAPTDPPAPGEGEGVAGDRCAGPPGSRVGWVFSRPRGLNVPRRDGEWRLDHARPVFARPPGEGAPGPQVCALRADTSLQVVDPPVRLRRGEWWIPVSAGSIAEPD